MRATIKTLMTRLCPQCIGHKNGMTALQLLSIEVSTDYVGGSSVEATAMCGHGHQFEFYASGEYGHDINLNTVEWTFKPR